MGYVEDVFDPRTKLVNVFSGVMKEGCSKSLSNKAAGNANTEGVPILTRPPRAAKTAPSQVGYVEDFCEARTLLQGFFSSPQGRRRTAAITSTVNVVSTAR